MILQLQIDLDWPGIHGNPQLVAEVLVAQAKLFGLHCHHDDIRLPIDATDELYEGESIDPRSGEAVVRVEVFSADFDRLPRTKADGTRYYKIKNSELGSVL